MVQTKHWDLHEVQPPQFPFSGWRHISLYLNDFTQVIFLTSLPICAQIKTNLIIFHFRNRPIYQTFSYLKIDFFLGYGPSFNWVTFISQILKNIPNDICFVSRFSFRTDFYPYCTIYFDFSHQSNMKFPIFVLPNSILWDFRTSWWEKPSYRHGGRAL